MAMRLDILSLIALGALSACSGEATDSGVDAAPLVDQSVSTDSSGLSDSGLSDSGLSDSGLSDSGLSDSGLSEDAGPQAGDILFAPGHLLQVEIEISADDWALIRGEGRGLTTAMSGCERDYEYTYVSGRVTIDSQPYEDVAIRKKGYLGSLSQNRPSLKLNFGRLVEGRTHDGMKRMTLNNNKQDPSNTHQCMAYDLFARAGAIAPRCNFARVVVNGEDLGVFTHVESVKKPMLARYFTNNDGNLYEGQGVDFIDHHRDVIELKTNESENNRADFDRLSAALTVPDDQLLDALSESVDLDAFFTFWAMEVITGHWDSYSGGRNNYLAYHDPVSDRFYFIPWGTDGAFSMQRPFTPGNTAATVLAQGLIAHRLYTHPQGRSRYFERLEELFTQVWDEATLLDEADRIQALTEAPQDAVDAQKSFIISHGAAIQRELEMAPVEWIGGDPPIQVMCRDTFVTEARGEFSTTWSSNHMPSEGHSLDITLDSQPWTPAQLLGSAGLDQTGVDSAQIRYLSPQPDGTVLVMLLSMPLSSFSPGERQMHGFETKGILARFNPRNPSSFVMIGVIGDGQITLNEASRESGGAVSGFFEGQLLQLRPL